MTCIICGSSTSYKDRWYSGPTCRSCYNKKYKRDNAEKIKANKKDWNARNKDKIKEQEVHRRNIYRKTDKGKKSARKAKENWHATDRGKYKVAKLYAKRKKLEFTLEMEKYLELRKQNCYYCNEKNLSMGGVGLDRIDNDKGYIDGNVLPCCKDCNRTRGDRYTVEEAKLMITFIIDYRKNINER